MLACWLQALQQFKHVLCQALCHAALYHAVVPGFGMLSCVGAMLYAVPGRDALCSAVLYIVLCYVMLC